MLKIDKISTNSTGFIFITSKDFLLICSNRNLLAIFKFCLQDWLNHPKVKFPKAKSKKLLWLIKRTLDYFRFSFTQRKFSTMEKWMSTNLTIVEFRTKSFWIILFKLIKINGIRFKWTKMKVINFGIVSSSFIAKEFIKKMRKLYMEILFFLFPKTLKSLNRKSKKWLSKNQIKINSFKLRSK